MKLRKFQCRSLLLIIALPALLGLNVLFGGIQFDDNVTILGDDRIKDPGLLMHLLVEGGYFERFVLRATFSLNFHMGKLNTFGYHLLNILIHVFNGVLVFFLCVRFTVLLPGKIKGPNPAWEKTVFLFPLLSALIFLLLPIQTETTAYISSRSSALATFFFLSGVCFFLRFLWAWEKNRGAVQWIFPLLGMVFCILLGVGTKQIIFTFPVILLLVYFLRSEHSWILFAKKNKVLLMVFFLVPLFLLGFRGNDFYRDYQKRQTVWQGQYLNELKKGYVNSESEFIFKRGLYSIFGLGAGYEPSMYSPYSYLLTQMNVVPKYYLRKILFPLELNVQPDIPVVKEIGWNSLCAFFFMGILILAPWRFRRWHAMIPLSVSWFFITLLPTSSFLPLFDLAAEHHTYIATPGFSMFAGLMLSVLFARKWDSKIAGLRKPLMLLIFLCFSAIVMARNVDWNTLMGLWTDAAQKSPRSPRVHHNLALSYVAKNQLHLAISEYQKSLSLSPSGETYNNLAMAYKRLGLYDKAIQTYEKAILEAPELPTTYYNLGFLYHDLGQYGKALESYEKAILYKDRYPEAHNNIGDIYMMMNQLEKAVAAFKKAVEIRPFHFESLNNLGAAYQKMGEHGRAEQYLSKAVSINPSSPLVHLNIGFLYLKMGKVVEAERHLREAIGLDHGLEPAYANLGDLLIEKKQFQEAIEVYGMALKLNPGNPIIHRNLGIAYYSHLDDKKKALYHFKRTLELNPGQDHSEEMKKIIENLTN